MHFQSGNFRWPIFPKPEKWQDSQLLCQRNMTTVTKQFNIFSTEIYLLLNISYVVPTLSTKSDCQILTIGVAVWPLVVSSTHRKFRQKLITEPMKCA